MPLSEFVLTDTGCTERFLDKKAIELLRYYEPLALEKDPRGYHVGFSGGKDSLVVESLMQEAGVKHFCVYNITGLDAPELVYFKNKKFEEYRLQGIPCHDSKYKRNIMQQMESHATPPTRLIRYCCEELKEQIIPDFAGCVQSFGVRQLESQSRAKNRSELEVGIKRSVRKFTYDNHENRRNFEVCYSNNNKGQIRINPIALCWSDTDVWDYIKDRKLEYCELYDEGFKRLGCVGCPMAGKHRVYEFKRWPGLERIWRRGFSLMWEMRKIRKAAGREYKIDFLSIEEWWQWWLELTPKMEAQIIGQLEWDMEA